ncbi:SRPBCC domain-containing protein [Phenylobacterium aquaticum]|uniref:SRPBCC domain-containing protein n=1 Tax=Phenylobacterium aquaticum TaxID=1763816 RepID=UPI001F5CD126|nr:SRPBCC domain-containing protein [Phenylobacterium aquaticum]MCI3132947.1 SRPBCC domain-containing protein [Phenylobacterium aquaticum]
MAIKPGEMFKPSAGFAFGGGGGGGAPAGGGGAKIEHRIGVKAPARVLWSIISDLPRWSEWNPIYPKAQGEIRIGSVLTLTLALPGEAHRTIQPVVQDWVPDEQLHWRLTMLGGLVKNVRFIEIEKLSEENSILSNGEIFGGLMGPSIARRMRKSIRKGFTEMGEILAARAEAAWRAEAGDPTSRS